MISLLTGSKPWSTLAKTTGLFCNKTLLGILLLLCFSVTAAAQPEPPSATGGQSCGPGPVTLSASGCTGGTVRWYAAPFGGPVLAEGLFFQTPVLQATTTYYAACFDGSTESSRVPVVATIIQQPSIFVNVFYSNCSMTLTVSGPAGFIYTVELQIPGKVIIQGPKSGSGSTVAFEFGNDFTQELVQTASTAGASNTTFVIPYTITAQDPLLGCSWEVPGIINFSSSTYSTSELLGGYYCEGGAGAPIRLTNSWAGVSYQLETSDGEYVGAPVIGTGGTINFPSPNPVNDQEYRAWYINPIGCKIYVGGVAELMPITTFNLTGGTYCYGDQGLQITMSGSQMDISESAAVSYQLRLNGRNIGEPMPGTGEPIIFPPVTEPGTYTVVATGQSGCSIGFGVAEVSVSGCGIPVQLTCPSDVVVTNSPGACTAAVTGIDPTVTPQANDPLLTYTLSGATSGSGTGRASGMVFNKGLTTVTFQVAGGSLASCSFNVNVSDTEPPVIHGLFATPSVLWTPNHKMVDVELFYTSTDNCGSTTCSLNVSSNEPQNGLGDGDQDNDWTVINNHHVRVQAERSGSGSGRIYTLMLNCTDASGNRTQKIITVTVPIGLANTTTTRAIPVGEASHPDEEFSVRVFPNPSAGLFVLKVSGSSAGSVTVQVMDALGQLVERKSGFLPGQLISLGRSYGPGVYWLEVEQAGRKRQVKLVKQ